MKSNGRCRAGAIELDQLESRRLMSASYATSDLGAGSLTTGRLTDGVVRINNNYQLANLQGSGTNNIHGFLTKGSKTTELKPLKGSISAFATDVSETGVAVGLSGTTTATKWSSGVASSLGSGQANGISNNGKYIVGTHPKQTSGGLVDHAYRFGSGAIDLGTLGGSSSRAYDANNSGIIVGSASLGSGVTVPFYYDGKMHQIGAGTTGEAFAINDSGIVVGKLGNQAYTFDVSNKTLTMLDPAPLITVVKGSGALDINNAGQIVGYTQDSNFNPIATYWSGTTGVELGTQISGSFKLQYGKTINDKGQIFAVATKAGVPRALKLSPYDATVDVDGTLTISGTIADDVTSVALSGSKVKVTVNGASIAFSKASIQRMSIVLGSGNDTLTLGKSLRSAIISAGSGIDTLYIRNSVNDIVNGGSGKDKAQVDAGDSLTSVESVLP